MRSGLIKSVKEGRGYFLSPDLYSSSLPLFFIGLIGIIRMVGMMKGKQSLLHRKTDVKGMTIYERTKTIQTYKNGNIKIPGVRSISPANAKRKRSMLLHHAQVRGFIKGEDFKGKYINAVREKKEDIKKYVGKYSERYGYL